MKKPDLTSPAKPNAGKPNAAAPNAGGSIPRPSANELAAIADANTPSLKHPSTPELTATRIEAVRQGYALGWSFTPLGGRDGKNPDVGGKGWQKRERESLEQAIAWAEAGNVGLRTGESSGVIVIDVDGDRIPEELPSTVTVRTGRGGWHLYFENPATIQIGNSAKQLREILGDDSNGGAKLDVRGNGGQVVFVGGHNYETGGLYGWIDGKSPADIPIAPFPIHLLSQSIDDMRGDVIARREAGESARSIASAVGIPLSTVRRWLGDVARAAPEVARATQNGAARATFGVARAEYGEDSKNGEPEKVARATLKVARAALLPAPPVARAKLPISPHLYNSWCKSALNANLKLIAQASEGSRNNTLNDAAFALGQMVGGNHLDRSEVESALTNAVSSAGWDYNETGRAQTQKTIRSGVESGMKQPRQYVPKAPTLPAGLSKPVKPAGPTGTAPPGITPPGSPPPGTPPSIPLHLIEHTDDDEIPRVVLGADEHRAIDEAVAALPADPNLYHRGGILVRVTRVKDVDETDRVRRPEGSSKIDRLPIPSLRKKLTKLCRIVTMEKIEGVWEDRPAHPPGWLVQGVECEGDWPGVRYLASISDAPVLRPDGSIHQTPGYDSVTGVLYEPAQGDASCSHGDASSLLTVPEDVSLDDAQAAVEVLTGVVADFTFESPEHRSAWLAALLTPLARSAFRGPAPLFLFDANVRGAGKTLLAQTCANIITGREMPASSYTADTDELRKRITAVAIGGDRMILLDNLEGTFGNDTLDRALTSTRWQDRILGRSEQVELPLLATWYATGNNVIVAADTARRIIHCRLDVLEERPEDRAGFKHKNLLGWIHRNRMRDAGRDAGGRAGTVTGMPGEAGCGFNSGLLGAALTILSAYLRSGQMDHVSDSLTPYGSFEGWSSVVRGALVWAGVPDPVLTKDKLAASADSTAETLGQLIEAFRMCGAGNASVAIPELLSRLYADGPYRPNDPPAITMRAALEQLTGARPGMAPSARQVGNRMKAFRRRVYQGYFLDVDNSFKNRTAAKWKLYKNESSQ